MCAQAGGGAPGSARGARQEVGQLGDGDAGVHLEGGNPVAVQALGQRANERVFGVGRGAVHDEPVAGHADAQHRVVLEDYAQPRQQALLRGVQRGVAARVHRTALGGDRELDQRVAERLW
jgi:hypothetical protein